MLPLMQSSKFSAIHQLDTQPALKILIEGHLRDPHIVDNHAKNDQECEDPLQLYRILFVRHGFMMMKDYEDCVKYLFEL